MINIIFIALIIVLVVESLLFIYFYISSKESFREQEKITDLYQEQEKINELTHEKAQLLQDIADKKQEIEELYNSEKEVLANKIKIYKDSTTYAGEQYVHALEQQYLEIENKYDARQAELKQQEEECKQAISNYKKDIDKLKSALNAATVARLREQEKEEQINFYKLSLTKNELDDISKIDELRSLLHEPVVLSKLIWTTYFQKQAVELCNRILGTTEKVCGIYKITDLETKQSYIGQSTDISRRLQEHIKCGLGINTPSSNKLYKAMQEDRVWNFTFEKIEECPKEQLNEKERFYIDLYKTYDYGLNSARGNK